MRIQEIQHGLLLAGLLLLNFAVLARGDAFLTAAPRAAFVPRRTAVQSTGGQREMVASATTASALSLRGGATLASEEDSDEEEDESEDEEEEEDEVAVVEEDSDEEEEEEEEEDESSLLDASLAAAAVKSTQKAKFKAQSTKTATVKKTMSAKLSAKPKKKTSLLKFLRVPYILRAFLNPFTVASMTKHFWLSLVNLEYPPKVSFIVSYVPCRTA